MKAKEQGYSVILDIGCKGMTLATNAIMSTAVKVNRILFIYIQFFRKIIIYPVARDYLRKKCVLL